MSASSDPQSLGTVLQSLIDEMGLRRRLDAARVVEAWAVLAGPRINALTRTAYVRHRTLHVRITSSAWRHQLHLQREGWRDRLNEELGEALIDEIVFR